METHMLQDQKQLVEMPKKAKEVWNKPEFEEIGIEETKMGPTNLLNDASLLS